MRVYEAQAALADLEQEFRRGKKCFRIGKIPKNFYEITFEKPGGLVMPLIVDYTYADGSVERVNYPVQVWRKNDAEIKKVLKKKQGNINFCYDRAVKDDDSLAGNIKLRITIKSGKNKVSFAKDDLKSNFDGFHSLCEKSKQYF